MASDNTPNNHLFLDKKSLINLTITFIASLAAIFSAYAALSLKMIENDRSILDQKLAAVYAVSDWTKNHTTSGQHCVNFLTRYGKSTFEAYATSGIFQLLDTQKDVADKCFVGYDKEYKKKFIFEPKKELSNDEKSWVAHQVTDQLANYERLAMTWSVLENNVAKDVICKQVKIKKGSTYRTFMNDAEHTKWWGYPVFKEYMDHCK